MRTQIIHSTDSSWFSSALKVLISGGLVAFPTDTVYGLGGMVFNENAVERIYEIKIRPESKAIPVLLSDPSEMELVCSHVPVMAKVLAAHFWPGPITLVVPKHPGISEKVSRTETIGLRIPDHTVARELLHGSGPLAVTSANISGMQNPKSASDVIAQLDGMVDLVIDGGCVDLGSPSTVVNCMGSEPELLREGPISIAQILQVLNK